MINPEEYLTIVAAYIRRDGYVKSAYQDRTWEKALVRYESPEKSDNIQPTRDDERTAKDTILYFLEQENTTSDYVNRVRTILDSTLKQGKQLEKRDLPFIASAVQSYLKNQQYKKEKEDRDEIRRKEAVTSNYVGQVGDKITVQVSDMSYKVINSVYGETNLYKFIDGWGNIFIWFTGKYVPENISEISGTVKEHKEFNGVRQTVLTRCKFR